MPRIRESQKWLQWLMLNSKQLTAQRQGTTVDFKQSGKHMFCALHAAGVRRGAAHTVNCKDTVLTFCMTPPEGGELLTPCEAGIMRGGNELILRCAWFCFYCNIYYRQYNIQTLDIQHDMTRLWCDGHDVTRLWSDGYCGVAGFLFCISHSK